MARAYYTPLRPIAQCAFGMRTRCGSAFYSLVLNVSSLVPLGQAAAYSERSRSLGHHAFA